jgi:hypothetical protein
MKADHEGWFAALYPRTLVLSVPIRENLASQREGNLLCLCIGSYKNGLQELLGTIRASHSDGEWPHLWLGSQVER